MTNRNKTILLLPLRKNKRLEGERDEARSKQSVPSEEGIALRYVRGKRRDMARSQPPYDRLFLRQVSLLLLFGLLSTSCARVCPCQRTYILAENLTQKEETEMAARGEDFRKQESKNVSPISP